MGRRERISYMSKSILLSSEIFFLVLVVYSSEISDLCLIKLFSETLQNLPYFWNKKTHVVFFSFFILFYFIFSLMNALVLYVDIDQGIH